MLKRWFHIIILVLLLAYPLHLHAAAGDLQQGPGVLPKKNPLISPKTIVFDNDTNRIKRAPQNRMDIMDHSIIKEVPKTKRQPKPEKIVTATPVDTAANKNPRSKRRPEGVERPPDITRRNNN